MILGVASYQLYVYNIFNYLLSYVKAVKKAVNYINKWINGLFFMKDFEDVNSLDIPRKNYFSLIYFKKLKLYNILLNSKPHKTIYYILYSNKQYFWSI